MPTTSTRNDNNATVTVLYQSIYSYISYILNNDFVEEQKQQQWHSNRFEEWEDCNILDIESENIIKGYKDVI